MQVRKGIAGEGKDQKGGQGGRRRKLPTLISPLTASKVSIHIASLYGKLDAVTTAVFNL